MDRQERFRRKLVTITESVGREIVERAEELVGACDMVSDFTIQILYPINSRYLLAPEIRVEKAVVSKEVLKLLRTGTIKPEEEEEETRGESANVDRREDA